MKVYITYCPRCRLTWQNPEKRDYSKDTCTQCRGLLEFKGEQEIKQIGIPNPIQKFEASFRDDIF